MVITSYLSSSFAQNERDNTVVLNAILADEGRWEQLIESARERLELRYPDLNIEVQYEILPYDDIKATILQKVSNNESVDLISVDQIWLSELAEKQILTDLTNFTDEWGNSSDWYQANWDGGVYEGKIYGIWGWTDIRGIWYWKDLLRQADVDPELLKTWNGYINASKRLNEILRPYGIEGMHLVGASHAPDMFYPYLWMLGGEIFEMKNGHPKHGSYWFPTFNSSEGVMALEFIKKQIDAGIKAQKDHFWGQEFVNRSFAVMIEGSWMPGEFPLDQWSTLEQKVGFIPMFPVPYANNTTATMMGGWELSIPTTTTNKELAWELITFMLDPEVLTPMLLENGYLPTQIPIGDGPFSANMSRSIPYFEEMVSMVPLGHKRPNVPEYPLVTENIGQAINQIYNGSKQPNEALQHAAAISADELGW
jgi:multiple sugar transport system substrate-binding protein